MLESNYELVGVYSFFFHFICTFIKKKKKWNNDNVCLIHKKKTFMEMECILMGALFIMNVATMKLWVKMQRNFIHMRRFFVILGDKPWNKKCIDFFLCMLWKGNRAFQVPIPDIILLIITTIQLILEHFVLKKVHTLKTIKAISKNFIAYFRGSCMHLWFSKIEVMVLRAHPPGKFL